MANTTNIGIPPYIQSNQSGDSLNLNTYDPETGTEMQAINRKQQIANLLVQQSLTPRQGQMVGNVYVPAGWGQGAAQIGQALAGAYMTHRNDKSRQGLEAQSRQDVTNAVQAYTESQQGKPALTMPEGTDGPERPAIPPTAEGQRAGLIRLMTNQNPAVQRLAAFEAQRQAKAADMAAQQQNALALQAAQAKSALEQKAAVSGDAALANTRHIADRNSVSATDQARLEADAARQARELQQHQKDRETVSETDRAKLTQADRQHSDTLAQQQTIKTAEMNLQERLHDKPSGNALASVDAQAALATQQHNDRVAQMEQNRRQDEATLELRRQQGMSEQDYKRDKLVMDERHQKIQETLEKERNDISKQLHAAQQRDGNKPPAGYRYTADGNLQAIPGGPADIKAQAASSKLEGGRQTVNDLVAGLRDHYRQLDQAGGITNPEKGMLDNLAAGAGSSGVGQAVGRMFGTQNQSLRNTIAQQRPLLLNAIKEATGMSAKQMDSNAEMKMYLAAATDPTLDIKANLEALDMLDKLYGLGRQNGPAGGGATAPPQPPANAPAKISSDADYNALPSGAVFIAPDGKQRRKP